MIAEHLRATGRFSGFGEPLNHDLVINRCEQNGITSFEDYLDWLLDNVRKPYTQLGLKASLDQVLMLLRSGAIPRVFGYVRWMFVASVISFALSPITIMYFHGLIFLHARPAYSSAAASAASAAFAAFSSARS